MDAREAALIAKKYFEDTRTMKTFIFETGPVKREDDHWIVNCIIKELFDDKEKSFKVTIDDEGAILDVEKAN